MKLLSLLALVVAVSASSIRLPPSCNWLKSKVENRKITDNEFRPNREYKFFYNGQLATGIPGSSRQHSATRIQSVISLVFRSEHECKLMMKNVRFGKLNDDLSRPSKIMPFSMFEEVEIESELLNRLKKPVKFNYRNGVISDLEFDGSEQPWSANIKRGVLNLLQVNLKKERLIETSPELKLSEDNEEQTFKSMERTIEGECETLTTVVPGEPCRDSENKKCREESERTPVWHITKSINFEKCNKRPDVRYNERFQQICPTCEDHMNSKEKSLRSSTVQKLNVVCESPSRNNKKSCLVEESSIKSQYHLLPFNEEGSVITTYVEQTLELVKTSSVETEMPTLSSPVKSDSDMVYTMDWDARKEEFFLNGESEFHSKTPFSRIEGSKVEFVKTILDKLMHYMNRKVDEEAPRQFTRLVKVMRMLKRDELKECHERFFESSSHSREEHEKIKDLLVDAMAMCGTHDCLSHLIKTIEKNEISNTRSAMVIRKLMSSRVVSKEMVNKVMSICKSTDKCKNSPQIKQAVYLTVGSMMRTLCNENRDKLAIESKRNEPRKCSRETKKEFVKEIMEKFHETKSESTKLLMLKTLSNAAFDVSIKPLEKIIKNENKNNQKLIRIEAVLALRQLTDKIPNKVGCVNIVKVLLPVKLNKREPSELRIAALYQIMKSMPEKLVIDQITRSMKTERCPQVAAFTYTLLQTLANSTIPCEKRMANDIKLSLRQGRYLPVSKWMKESKFLRVVDEYSRKSKLGVQVELASVMSSHSPLPKTLSTTLNINAARMFSPKFVSVNFRQEGVGRILNRIIRSESHNLQSSLENLLSGNFELPSPRFNYRSELKEIFEKLNIEDRSGTETKPMAMLNLMFKNQEYAFLPLSKESIPEELKELLSGSSNVETSSFNRIVKRVQRMLKDVQLPFSFTTATFMHEQSHKIPTSIGLPLHVSIKVPTVLQASGMLEIETDSESPFENVKFSLKSTKPSMASTVVTKMESWSPIVNSGLKVLIQGKVFTPFEGELKINSKKEPTEVEFTWKPEHLSRKEELVTIQSRPVTFTTTWPTSSIKKWIEPEEKTVHSQDWNRVSSYKTEFGKHSVGVKFESRANWHRLPKKHVPTTPIALLAGPNKYTLTMEPGHEMPKEITVRVSSQLFKSYSDKHVNVNFENFYKDSSESFLATDSSEESSSESREERNKRSLSYKGKEPVHNKIEVEIFTKGSSIKRKVDAKVSCMCDKNMKACKCKTEVERTPVPTKEEHNWKLESEVEVLYPKTPKSISEVTSDKKLMGKISAKWGPKSNMNKEVDIKIVAEQSNKMEKLRERSLYKRMHDNEQHRTTHKSLFSPVAQYKPLMKFGILDEIKINADFKINKEERQLVSNLLQWIRNKYYSQSQVKDVEVNNPSNKVQIKLNIDPQNRRYVNVSINSPRQETKFIDIPLMTETLIPNMRRPSSPSKSFYSVLRSTISPSRRICEVRSHRINTFDDEDLEVPTSTCFSVLAKDCRSRENSKFAVLIKKKNENTEKKVLKIVTPKVKLVVKPKSDSDELECEVNGEKKRCNKVETVREHRDHTVLRVREHETDMIEIDLPEAGIRVFFDGYSANLKVSSIYNENVCGLCNIENESEELRSEQTSKQRRERILERFLITENSECKHELRDESTEVTFEDFEPQNRRRFNSRRSNSRRSYYSDSEERSSEEEELRELPEWRDSPIRSRHSNIRPVERTKVIEQHHELCFSKQPIKKCPRGTFPTEHENTREKVVFTCMPRNELEAESLHRRVSRGQEITEDLRNHQASFTETERVPKSCRRF